MSEPADRQVQPDTVAAPAGSRKAAGSLTRHQSHMEHAEAGKRERDRIPRKAHAGWESAPDRPDPIAVLEAQGESRVPELVPIRYGRMAVSPFTFYRGAAAVMAADLAAQPRTNLKVQLCGDAHLSNFGIYMSPERNLVFDVNDFDETLAGPFEWDTKRLAASIVVAGRALGWPRSFSQRAVMFAMGSYRLRMAEYAGMGALDTWYSRITVEDIRSYMPRERRATGVQEITRLAVKKDNLGALNKLTEVVDGKRRFREAPPLLVRAEEQVAGLVDDLFRQYRRTLTPDRRQLLDRYRFVDLARKVVGVGSVGTRCWVVYLEGHSEGDPLFLQVKEAQASVLEPYLGKPPARHHGQRVVVGQKLMQAASDVFLGWMTGPLGPHYYWRQLWDAKFSADLEAMRQPGILAYARICGWALARAHARSGNAAAIAAYMGSSGRFERSMLEFSEAYADQNDRDHAALVSAIETGRVQSVAGI
jgi:uncharacterized protein (DUF2252 family)